MRELKQLRKSRSSSTPLNVSVVLYPGLEPVTVLPRFRARAVTWNYYFLPAFISRYKWRQLWVVEFSFGL
jgi:hypothetical protein